MTYMFTTGGNRTYYDLNNYAPKINTTPACQDTDYIGTCTRVTNRIPQRSYKATNNVPFDKVAFMQFLRDFRNE